MAVDLKNKELKKNFQLLAKGGKEAKIKALYALGKLDDPAAIPALVAALKNKDADVRALAMGKLVFLNDKSIIPTVVNKLGDRNAIVRQHAVYALERLKATTAANDLACLLVDDTNMVVRLNAIIALYSVGTKAQKAAVLKALSDDCTDVVLGACRWLAKFFPQEAYLHILKLIQDGKRWGRMPETQSDVIIKLFQGKVNKAPVAKLLRKIVVAGIERVRAKKSGYTMDEVEAAYQLAMAGDSTGVPVMQDCLHGGEYSQEKGMRALAKLRHECSTPLVVEKPLKNEFYPIRVKAVRALAELGDTRALPALANFFTVTHKDFPVTPSLKFAKEDPDLRINSLTAMAKISIRALRRATQSPDAFVRKTALASLKDIK